jgi:tetratricopeptide (TPR) repeat protein
MEVAAQIRQNSKEYSDFVSDLNKWTREAQVSTKDELLLPTKTESKQEYYKKNKQEYYRKWEEFDVEKELENVDYAVEPDKTDDRYSRVKEALVRKELGNEYFKKGFFKKALSEYTGSLTLDWNEKTLANRALVWLKLDMYDECIKDCSQLIEMDSKSTKGYWRRGLAKFSLGDVQGARKDLEFAMVLEPGNKGIKDDLQKTKTVKKEKIRPERVRVEIQEVGVCHDDGKEKELMTIEKTKESPEVLVKERVDTDLKIVENHVEKLQVSDVEIMKPGCFMDFERDFKRFKKDKQVLYLYIKVILLK